MQSISLETIISAHIALIHNSTALKLKALSLTLSLTPNIPCSPSNFLSPCHVFFFFPLFSFLSCASSVILFIWLTLPSFLISSVGRLLIEFSSQMTMERVQKENPNVTEGGRYTPPDCRPRWKVCTYIYIYVFSINFCYKSPFWQFKNKEKNRRPEVMH